MIIRKTDLHKKRVVLTDNRSTFSGQGNQNKYSEVGQAALCNNYGIL